MADDRHDYIAISDHGVFALHEDDGSADCADWIAGMQRAGWGVERVPVEEAVGRHLAYLRARPEFAGLL